VRDQFDEFMETLRRRQAEAEGRDPDADREAQPPDEDAPASSDDASPASSDEDGTGDDEVEEPRPIRPEPRPIRSRRDGPPPPKPVRPVVQGDEEPPSRRGLILPVLIVAIGLLILVFLGFGVDFWTDAIWFRSVGFESVFWTRVGTQFWLFVGVLVLAAVVLLLDLWLARRLLPPESEGDGTGGLRGVLGRFAVAAREAERTRTERMSRYDGSPWGSRPVGPSVALEAPELPDLTPIAGIALGALAILIAIGLAVSAASAWETFLLWRNQVAYAASGTPVTDPIFHKDIGFFLFQLPFLRLVQSLANGLILGALVIAGGRYLVAAMRGGPVFVTRVRVHLAVLGFLYLLTVAAGYQLDKLELVYGTNGGAWTGVAYTDFNARFLALDVLTVVAALAGAFLVVGASTRMVWPLAGAIVVWFGASVLLGTVYPEAIQRFVVAPNPFANEQPFIENNIAMTRMAYGLDTWTQKPYSGDQPLTAEKVQAESATFQNARLWDYRPLGTTIDQLQTVRQYYDFVDVDTDRYQIAGSERQVMLSARELDLAKSQITENWLNTTIIYTHGIGLVMTPVNEVVGQGQPQLWIRDLPPVSSNGAPTITQPRIYFGEAPTGYVIVGAKQPEFDYPLTQGTAPGSSDTGAQTRWTGTSGIRLDSLLTRLLFSARVRDLNLLISDQITDQSQILLHRSITDRLPRIAPFLRYDKDPYLVVTGSGGLVYIQDAYTVSDRFPNADPYTSTDPSSGLSGASLDYVRNSVKVVMDAYTGQTTFYVADPSDPIIRAYEGVFPGMFKPLSAMPSDLRAHIRYPEELFNAQTTMFGRYHVTDPLTFFNQNDLWQVPAGQTSEQTLPSEAYYVEMRMPGEAQTEFLLLQPMVPKDRPNMIAWVAARNDTPNYGEVRYYQFPSNTTVFGPVQVEALIDQDPGISSQITLWNQSGSKVIRGNLLVVPVQDSIVYLQPVYLQSTGSAFPEFQKIVVATPGTVVWADTLDAALRGLLTASGQSPGPSPSPSPGPSPSATPSPTASAGPTPPSGDLDALIAYANEHFQLAQQALRNGDFATYGAEMQKVQQALSELAALTASPTPSSPAGGSSAP
jgi:uncharacterized membrane protein (UPF0182 family)